MTSAAIYCRISADREGRELGVERQEEDARALADRLGFMVTRVYVDNDVSASTLSRKPRPAYRQMLDSTRAGDYAAILAYSNSRLTRRPLELEELIALHAQTKVRIATVVSGEDDLSTADGRMVARYKAVADAAEAERTSERARRAKLQAAQQGRYRGGRRPFGYEADGVTVVPAEAEALHDAARGVLAGRSLLALARELNARGITTSGGKPIDGVNLRRLLARPRNAGLLEQGGKVVGAAAWPAIIPEDTWRAVVATFADPTRRTTPGPERRWLGSGVYLCGVCGATLYGSRGRDRRWYYRDKAAHVARAASSLDARVRDLAAARLRRPDAHDLVEVDGDDAAVLALRERAEELRAKQLVHDADYDAGYIDGRRHAAATVRTTAELTAVLAQLAGRQRDSVLAHALRAPDPGAWFLDAPLDAQRAIVDALMIVTVNRGRRGRPAGWQPGQPYVDLESVDVVPRRGSGG